MKNNKVLKELVKQLKELYEYDGTVSSENEIRSISIYDKIWAEFDNSFPDIEVQEAYMDGGNLIILHSGYVSISGDD